MKIFLEGLLIFIVGMIVYFVLERFFNSGLAIVLSIIIIICIGSSIIKMNKI